MRWIKFQKVNLWFVHRALSGQVIYSSPGFFWGMLGFLTKILGGCMSSFSHPCSLAMQVLAISCSLLPSQTPSLTPGDSLSLFSPVRFIQLSMLRLEIHSSPDQSNHSNPVLSATVPWPCGPGTSHAPSLFGLLSQQKTEGFFGLPLWDFGVFFSKLSRLDIASVVGLHSMG